MVINFFAAKRTFISRIVGVVSFLILSLTRTRISENIWIETLLDNTGLFLIVAGVLGRIWASMYICGYKTKQIIDQGPYSTVRNPLYFFSFLGVMGIGFSSGNLIFMGLIITLFLLYYPMVIIHEEQMLKEKFGEVFLKYAQTTPRFIPKHSRYHEPEAYSVKVSAFSRSFLDGIWFFLGYIAIEIIKTGHQTGIIPVFFST